MTLSHLIGLTSWEQGCGQAFLGDSLRSPRPSDLLGLPIGFETGRSWLGVYNNVRLFLTEHMPVSDPDVSRPRLIRDGSFLENDWREIA